MRGAPGGRPVDHALLQPQRRQLEANALGDDARHVHGSAEDLDDVDALALTEHFRKLLEARHRRLTEDRLGEGIHRNDAIAKSLQRPGDAVTRTGAVGRESHHRDGAGVAQPLGDLCRRGIGEHRLSLAETDLTSSLVTHVTGSGQ